MWTVIMGVALMILGGYGMITSFRYLARIDDGTLIVRVIVSAIIFWVGMGMSLPERADPPLPAPPSISAPAAPTGDEAVPTPEHDSEVSQ